MRTLNTTRLQLRSADAAGVQQLIDADPALTRNALSAGARRWLEGLKTVDPRTSGAWLICRKVSRKMIGLFAYQAAFAGGAAEISYMILERWRYRGFGSEAAAAACGHLTDRLQTPVLFADVGVRNTVSEAILRRLGFTLLDTPELDLAVSVQKTPARRWLRPGVPASCD